MSAVDDFEVIWSVNDGYVREDCPRKFSVCADEIDTGDDEEALKELFWSMIEADFKQKVFYVSKLEDEFVTWAKTQQQRARAEDGE